MWPNPQETPDLATFTEESLMENFIFCAVKTNSFSHQSQNNLLNRNI